MKRRKYVIDERTGRKHLVGTAATKRFLRLSRRRYLAKKRRALHHRRAR